MDTSPSTGGFRCAPPISSCRQLRVQVRCFDSGLHKFYLLLNADSREPAHIENGFRRNRPLFHGPQPLVLGILEAQFYLAASDVGRAENG